MTPDSIQAKPQDNMPVAFLFEVVIKGAKANSENAFQEVSGLESEMDLETVQEGGENTFVHRVPKGVKHPNLVLKRGMAKEQSGLVTWCKDTLEGGLIQPIKPFDIDINLLSEQGTPSISWTVSRAWPIKWSLSGFNAEKNALAIETIEFAYNTISRSVK